MKTIFSLLISIVLLCSYSTLHAQCSPDVTPPMAVCQNVTVSLDGAGNGSLSGSEVDNGSSDACDASLSLSVSPNAFTCSNLGTPDNGSVTVTLTATDDAGNSDNCNATVTIVDGAAPIAVCQNVTVSLDATGNGSLSGSEVNNGSSDACDGSLTLSVSPNAFTCSNLGTSGNGSMTVTLKATDDAGNFDNCSATATIVDGGAPTAVCQDVTVQLDAAGDGSLSGSDVDNGSSDACDGSLTLSVSPNAFTCSDLGAVTVTLTTTDDAGNSDNCNATATIVDGGAPTAVCQNVTVSLDGTGNGSLIGSDVNNGSSDACDGSLTLSVSPNSFACSDLGAVTVTLTATDDAGNSDNCNATATIVDGGAPTAVCHDVTVQLDAAGDGSLSGSNVDNGSSDACDGSLTLSVSPNSFTCSDLGAVTVTLTATDDAGNQDDCTASVSIQDTVSPTAICQDVTITLDQNGNGSTTAGAVDNGSNDACGLLTLSIAPTTFNCSTIGGSTITLTATDVNGNSANCTANVTANESIDPVAACKEDTVYLNGQLIAIASPDSIDNGSSDNCGIDTMYLDVDTLHCSDLGLVAVVLTVEDAAGNTDTCHSTITVLNDPNQDTCCLDGQTDNHYIASLSEYTTGTTNNSGDDNGYGDYTHIVFTTVNPFYPYLYFLFTPGNVGPSDLQNWELYIDWNGNGGFEPSEKILDYCSSIPFARFIPLVGHSGGPYRMRLVMQSDTDNDGCQPGELPNPLCGSIGDGEVEEYTLEIATLSQWQSQIQSQDQLQVFPNPASDEIFFTLTKQFEIGVEFEVEVVTITGSLVTKRNVTYTSGPARINISGLSPGTYFLRVNTGAEVFVETVIKQ